MMKPVIFIKRKNKNRDDNIGSIAKIPIRGRLRKIKESLTYVPVQKKDEYKYRDILSFTRFLTPLLYPIILSLILSFVLSIFSTALPLSSKWIIDYIFMGQSIQPILDALTANHLSALIPITTIALRSLPALLILLAGVEIIKYFLSNEYSLINYRINTEYNYRMKIAVFSQVLRYPISFFRDTRSGYLLARITGDTASLNSISSTFLQGIISSGTSLVVTFFILTSISIPLTILVLFSVPITIFISYWTMKISQSYNIRGRESGLLISSDGQDLINAIDIIKTHAAEERELDRYAARLKENISLTLTVMLFGQLIGGVQRSINSGFVFLVMLVGGTMVIGKEMSIGDYTAFIALYPQLTGAISFFLQLPLSLQSTALASGRVRELLDMATEEDSGDPDHPLIEPDQLLKGEIFVDQVHFSYDENTPVLSGLSLHIHPGERVAITGPTGAGKTTLIHLLLRFAHPDSGKITIDGYDLKTLHPRWLRQQVAVVSQDLFLFHDTILNNIRYSRPDATDEEVVTAARMAGLHDEINTFPDGYNTTVGERGGKISGGQKQRLSIARALLRNSPVMILDEPTAHLDPETEERLIQEFLMAGQGKTMIIITHREQLARSADRVYSLRDGVLSE